MGEDVMAKKVEEKKQNSKTTKSKIIKENELITEEDVIDFEEYDDEDEIERKIIKSEKKVKEDKKIKRQKKVKKEDVLGDSLLKQNAELINFFKIIIAVVLFVGIFYLIVALARGEIGNKNKKTKEDVTTSIQNEEILASSIFNKKDKEYYVLLFDADAKNTPVYATMYSDYQQSGSDKPMYYVNLSNKFNKDIVSEKTNSKAQKYDELKVSSPTLIHIKNGKNVDYYEGDNVKKQIINLIK